MGAHGTAVVRRTSRLMRVGLLLFIAVAAGGCGGSGTAAANRLDKAIRTEVPAVATRQQAEAWLDARGVDHIYLTDTTGDRSGSQTMPMLAGLQDEDLGGMVRGMITCPNTAAGVKESGRLSIYFFFDKQGGCVGHLVHWFEYSL